jgi:predicted nucleotidyltransferase
MAAAGIVNIMTRADIIAVLRNQAPDIRALGATSLYLFGSAARGEAKADSDVDLFIDYDPERFSFIELIRLRERLSHILGRSADLTTREGLHPLLRPDIEAEAIKVF